LIITALSLKKKDSKIENEIVKAFNIAKLGTVHTALQIGDKIIEWNKGALVVRKKII
jgi:hypothetical protein